MLIRISSVYIFMIYFLYNQYDSLVVFPRLEHKMKIRKMEKETSCAPPFAELELCGAALYPLNEMGRLLLIVGVPCPSLLLFACSFTFLVDPNSQPFKKAHIQTLWSYNTFLITWTCLFVNQPSSSQVMFFSRSHLNYFVFLIR